MPRRGYDRGTAHQAPLRVSDRLTGQTRAFEDTVFNQCPRLKVDRFEDFADAQETFTVDIPLTTIAGAHAQATTAVNSGWIRIPRAGRLVSVTYTGVEALTANDTNYLTFTLVNTLASGSGTTAMLAATDANTTKATGGTGITAIVGRSLTVHGTAANLRVAAGDVVTGVETVTGTLANAVTRPTMRLTFATIPKFFTPRITRTAGSPLVGPVDDAANGTAILQLSATNEANVAAIDWDDQLVIDPTKEPIFSCRLKVSGVAAVTRMIWGLATAYNATLDSVAENAWFRLEGNSLALVVEADDATTNTDDQSTGRTLTADTYYVFTVDFSQGTGKIRFFVDDDYMGSITAAALATTHLMQPIIAIQKDSGVGEQSVTVDWARVTHSRI